MKYLVVDKIDGDEYAYEFDNLDEVETHVADVIVEYGDESESYVYAYEKKFNVLPKRTMVEVILEEAE